MDYIYELKELLRPLRLYELEEGAGAKELEVLGRALNEIFDRLSWAEANAQPLTADEEGLALWESLLPYAPASLSLEDRRRAVAALLSIDGRSFTVEALNHTLSGCGIRAIAEETAVQYTVEVGFPDVRGKPEGIEKICARIKQILPCHLDIVYRFVYVTWQEIEDGFSSWQEIENGIENWQALECWMGEG